MATTVKVPDAKTHLSAILAGVERGAEVVIVRGDVPVAMSIPSGGPGDRELGSVSYRLPDSFFEALPDVEQQAWEQ